MASKGKYVFEEVSRIFEKAGCTLLSTSSDYKKMASTLVFVCGECQCESSMRFDTFVNGKPKMCAKCRVKNRVFSRPTNTRYNQQSVEKLYNSHGCVFKDTYESNDRIYKFVCSCGKEDEKLFYQFMKVPCCKDCSNENKNIKIGFSTEYVKEYMSNLGCELIGEYTNCKDSIEFICVNGHLAKSTFDSIKINNNGRCRQCATESVSGENNYNWKGGVYDDERIKFRKTYEFKQWRNAVFKRDGYKCKICGTHGVINAHHKDGYNWCVERRVDVDNGVTLCEEHHKAFHKKYGTGDNTEKQFQEFYIEETGALLTV